MAGKKKITRILISIIFIALGVDSVIRAFESLLALDIGGVLACALGIMMFATGIMGLLKVHTCTC